MLFSLFCYLIVFLKECDLAIAINYRLSHKLVMNAVVSDSSRWEGMAELPAIDHKIYLEHLEQHVKKSPQRNVLIVYGGKSVGKSTIITKKIEEWRGNGHVVVDVDLWGQKMIPDDLLNQFVNEYVKGCEMVNKTAGISDSPKNKMAKTNRISKRVNIVWTKVTGALKALPFSTQLFIDDSKKKIYSAQLRAALVNALVDSFKNEELSCKFEDKFVAFINTLEDEALKGNRPILIIRDAQQLIDNTVSEGTMKVAKSLFQCFEKYKQGEKKLAVIIESSEYLWNKLRSHVRLSPESFRGLLVKQWSKEEGHEELVNKFEIFTSEEFEKVWNAVGGHAGQLFDLYEDLRNGTPLEQAIDNKNYFYVNAVRSLMIAREGCDYEDLIENNVSKSVAFEIVIRRRRDFLRMLKDSGFRIDETEIPLKLYPTVEYLCKMNILWRDNNDVTPLHKVIESAINVCVKK